jgi:hypothetical protein
MSFGGVKLVMSWMFTASDQKASPDRVSPDLMPYDDIDWNDMASFDLPNSFTEKLPGSDPAKRWAGTRLNPYSASSSLPSKGP